MTREAKSFTESMAQPSATAWKGTAKVIPRRNRWSDCKDNKGRRIVTRLSRTGAGATLAADSVNEVAQACSPAPDADFLPFFLPLPASPLDGAAEAAEGAGCKRSSRIFSARSVRSQVNSSRPKCPYAAVRL